MTYDLLLGLTGFAIVAIVTPGPNNFMLMASGANFGWTRTIPHMLGITFGVMVLIGSVGIGLAQLFDMFPVLHTVLKVAATGYMLWLAYKIATAAPASGSPRDANRPLTLLEAAGFQWVNPKAWSMALAAITIYTPINPSLTTIGIVCLTFGTINLPSASIWAWLGVQLTRWLDTPSRLRAFNITMAALLVASLWPILAT